MAELITDYLDESANRYPKKVAFADEYESITYENLKQKAYQIADQLVRKGYCKNGVAICLEQSVRCVSTMLGVLYSGNYYTVMDMEMPLERVQTMISILSPDAIVTDAKGEMWLTGMRKHLDIVRYEELLASEYDAVMVEQSKKSILSTNLSEILFTSGSTGQPKGVMLTHKGIISATESKSKRFEYCASDIFVNQSPFYFVGYHIGIFCALKNGATSYMIPKRWFLSPKRLVEFLKEKRITSLDFWVAPALCLIARYGALSDRSLPDVKTVAFGGETMPIQVLQMWENALPNARFVNVYGATELNGALLLYQVDRKLEYKEQLPLGIPVEGADVFLMNENGEQDSEEGELCIKSDQLAIGYYKNEEETKKKFLSFREKNGKTVTVYRTGDLMKYNERGELIFVGRKDFQIKRHGYRIELEEIEHMATAVNEVIEAACIYDQAKEKIVLFYNGCIARTTLKERMRDKLPGYMLPDSYIELEEIPRTINGKIDRTKCRSIYQENKK